MNELRRFLRYLHGYQGPIAMGVVREAGRIVEQGRHDQLLAQNGVYRRLHDLQFNQPQPLVAAMASPQPQPA